MHEIAPCCSAILISHADPLLRTGVAAALGQHSDFAVFVEAIEGVISSKRPISVIITDYDHAMRLARSAHVNRIVLSAPSIVVLTAKAREAEIRFALNAGIRGYILLGGTIDELMEGVQSVAKGLRYVSRSAAQCLAESVTHSPLTSRELEVLNLVAAGQCNKAIGRELRIQLNTVKSHMTAIMSKLDARSRTQAVAIANLRGLVEEGSLIRRANVGWRVSAPATRVRLM